MNIFNIFINLDKIYKFMSSLSWYSCRLYYWWVSKKGNTHYKLYYEDLMILTQLLLSSLNI